MRNDDLLFICIADDVECALEEALQMGGVVAGFPSNSYITEDASQVYITEDGGSVYVTEA